MYNSPHQNLLVRPSFYGAPLAPSVIFSPAWYKDNLPGPSCHVYLHHYGTIACVRLPEHAEEMMAMRK